MRILAAVLLVSLVVGCGDDAKKSTTNPNNVTNNNTNNVNNTNNTNNTNNGLTVDITQFDQTCDFDSSCQLANTEPCGCSCADEAINVSENAAFAAAVNAIDCGDNRPLCDVACIETVPACWQGQCQVREVYEVRAEDYDNSCETAADCIYIATGDPCSDCRCAATPVNKASYEENPPPAQECTPGPSACDCAAPPAIACIANVCSFGD
ncbi:MAG: hypothetical protein R3E66_00340 [bacterium]